jgi:CitMHS family citrate-Mg2+:H+ or citrate-Ca2+:H+ symporter
MIAVFMFAIIRKKLSPFTALVFIPLIFSVIAVALGLCENKLGEFAKEGLLGTALTGIMLLFAIFYFAIMLDAGLFDPVTNFVIRLAKGDPVKVLLGTAVVAACVSLNGDGTTTTMICCAAFVPVYKKLNMKMMNLAVIVVLQNTILNLLPWSGPTARVMSVLPVGGEILQYLAPGMIGSILYMLGISYYLGLKERKRIGVIKLTDAEMKELTAIVDPEVLSLRRPKNLLINGLLTIVLITVLVIDIYPSAFLFLIGTVLALLINYRDLKSQVERISANAGDACQTVILVFAAGIFMGLFNGTGMAEAVAGSFSSLIPESLGGFWGIIVAVISIPGTFFLSNDAFYYGVLPVLAETGYTYGFTPMQMALASLMGQAFHLLSPLVAFIYLLLRMTGQDMGEWQVQSAKIASGIFVIFMISMLLTGAMPLVIG